jgi:hypothetical protein
MIVCRVEVMVLFSLNILLFIPSLCSTRLSNVRPSDLRFSPLRKPQTTNSRASEPLFLPRFLPPNNPAKITEISRSSDNCQRDKDICIGNREQTNKLSQSVSGPESNGVVVIGKTIEDMSCCCGMPVRVDEVEQEG